MRARWSPIDRARSTADDFARFDLHYPASETCAALALEPGRYFPAGTGENLMLKWLPLVITLSGTLGAALITPSFVASHAGAFVWINAGSQVLHAIMPSTFGGPSAQS